MENHRFDTLTRTLATETTRRTALRRLAGGLLGAAVVVRGVQPIGASGNQVGICHKTWAWSTNWRYITVDANNQRRIQSHLEHGDTVDPDFGSDPNHCGGCGNACTAPENASAWCDGGSCGWSCNEGYDQFGDTCVERVPCQLYTSEQPVCYYLQQQDAIHFCWVPLDFAFETCRSFDSCSDGGGGEQLGGCYKWTNNSNDPFTEWPS